MGKKILVLTVVTAAAAFYIVKNCCSPPKLPQVDLEQWWGPNELKGKQDTSIRPFKVEFSEQMVKDLRQRLTMRRKFVPPLEGVGFSYGFNTNYIEKVLDFWRDSYNFQEREAFLNKFPHFKTNIQGLDMHYIHVKPAVKDVRVVPLLLLHGWPGSVREFYEVIPILTTKREGFDFVFELVVPSLPGYGFSSGAVRPGLGSMEMAIVMRNLMHRLGHKKYYIQGGDAGSVIGSIQSTLFPDEVLGYHSNLLMLMSPSVKVKEFLGSFYPPLVVEDKYADRMYPYGEKVSFMLEEFGYMHIQSTKPDTIGTALSDSPSGLATYILEKFSTWTNPEFKSELDGSLTKKFKLVDLLDNIMIYWTTNSITTSMRLYSETMSLRHLNLGIDDIPTPVPTWGLKAKHELFYQPDGFLRTKFKNLLGSTHIDDGGHFLALELPAVLAQDVFEAVAKFIEFHEKNVKTDL